MTWLILFLFAACGMENEKSEQPIVEQPLSSSGASTQYYAWPANWPKEIMGSQVVLTGAAGGGGGSIIETQPLLSGLDKDGNRLTYEIIDGEWRRVR